MRIDSLSVRSHTTIHRLLRLALIAATAIVIVGSGEPARATPSPPDGITGTFNESVALPTQDGSSGSMVYGVPFALPAARGSAQPALGLRYRSMSGTGDAGESWTLGLPSVERAPLSGWPKYVDSGDPASEDRYSFGGAPLTFVCVVGGSPACPPTAGPMPPWANGQRHYRLRVDGAAFGRFFLSSDRTRWTLQRRGGEILEFGTPSIRPELTAAAIDVEPGTGHIFRWNLTRQRDLHDARNLIVYSWAVSQERQRLTDIHYTPPATSWASAELSEFGYHVELSWESPEYLQYQYTHIDKRRPYARLRRVAVSAKPWSGSSEREQVRAYWLRYYAARGVPAAPTEAPLWNRSFLREVQLEGRCAGAVETTDGHIPEAGCPMLPSQTFEYSAATLAQGSAIRSSVGPNGLKYVANSALLDVDRDGRPDIVQAWPQNAQYGATGVYYDECKPAYPSPTVELWTMVRGGPVGDPRLVCPFTDGEVDIRSAREQVAFINRGALPSAPVSLERHCLDAGDGSIGTLTYWQIQEFFGSPAALFSRFGAENVGTWGDALLFWTKAENRGFGIEGVASGIDRTPFCPEAGGDPNFPALRWKQAPEVWAKRPPSSISGGTFIDVDGDGHADRIGTHPSGETFGTFQQGRIMLARRVSHLEQVDGITGPALVPMTLSPEASDAALGWGALYADVNGDGVVDLVAPHEDDVNTEGIPTVRPGDGRGHFGCELGSDPSCIVPGNGTWLGSAYRIFVPDAEVPWPLNAWDAGGLHQTRAGFFHDVTGDGLADIVVYEVVAGNIKLWVNVDGHTFRCANEATACTVGTITDLDRPSGLPNTYRVTFADVDANGMDDLVVLGNNAQWHFSFVVTPSMPTSGPRAPRPGLLTRIRNGVGADIEIAYETIQELDAAATVEDEQSFKKPWASHVPVVLPVVTRIDVRDTPAVMGTPIDNAYAIERRTTFDYRDPAYDLWERAFKGFGRVLEVRPSGEARQTWYWFGECQNGRESPSCAQTSDLSPDAAAAGLPVRVDELVVGISERPVKWLSTTTTQYGFAVHASPPPSADRDALTWAPVRTDFLLYDTELPVSWEQQVDHPTNQQPVPIQPGSRVHFVTEHTYDAAGNLEVTRDKGRQLEDLTFPDSAISTTLTGLPAGLGRCDDDWSCLPAASTITELRPGTIEPDTVRETLYQRNAARDLTKVSANLRYDFLGGRQPGLNRDLALGTGAPAEASSMPGIRVLSEVEVDEFGAPTRILGAPGPNRPCTVLERGAFGLVETTTQYAGGNCTGEGLRTSYAYDRGLQRVTAVLAPTYDVSTVDYDPFGRVAAVYAPAPDGLGTELALDFVHHDQAPASYVVSRVRVDIDAYITAVDSFNGAGEHVLGFDQADPVADGAPWILRDRKVRDGAGRPFRLYRPELYATDPLPVVTNAAPPSPTSTAFTVEMDEFNRPIFEYDDGLVTAAYTNKPLDVTIRDAEQNNPGSHHAGAYTRVRRDGHGRVFETIQQQNGEAIVTRVDRLATGEPHTIRRSRGLDSYTRTIGWDSLGRMTTNDEPNTSKPVLDGGGVPTGSRRGWVYVYL